MFDLKHHIRMTNMYTVLCLFVGTHVHVTCVLQGGKEAGYLLLVLLIFAFVYKECWIPDLSIINYTLDICY